MSWKRLDRRTIYRSPYFQLYEDKIELPNGNTVDDYTVFKMYDVIYILASNIHGEFITLNEYKYGANEVFRCFPAGHMSENEDPIEAAKRELLEETGYGSGKFRYLGETIPYQTKNISKIHIVIAENVEKVTDPKLEETEDLEVVLIRKEELAKEVKNGKWRGTFDLAAFTMSNLFNS